MKPIALITGASSGFGEAIARALAPTHRLILLARRADRLERLARELDTPTHLIAVDVRDKVALLKALDSLPEAFSDVEVLVNNAGLALGISPAQECKLEEWEQMVDTNIKGILYCTHALLPRLIERNRGYIINIGSTAGSIPYRGSHVYGASKAFVEQFSRNLRCDLLGKRVRVTTIKPGLAESEFSLVRFGGDEARAKAVYADLAPLLPEDIASIVRYLLFLPEHVNINELEVMPLCQSFAGTATKPL